MNLYKGALRLVVLFFFYGVLCAPGRAEHADMPRSKILGVTIWVEDGPWGKVGAEQVETALYFVADTFLGSLPQQLVPPVIVSHDPRNPVVLYDRGPNGEYRVLLHASQGRWAVFVYEFAHELCHILSNYGAGTPASRRSHKTNQWFEEALCEAASLYALIRLAEQWDGSAMAGGWKEHAPALRGFAMQLLAEKHRSLPEGQSAAVWLRNNLGRLRASPYQRELNEVVAHLLLPLFLNNPGAWNALAYLNLEPADAWNSLGQYLANWQKNAPDAHSGFIGRIISLLGAETGGAPDIVVLSSGGADR
ncbi:MAG: hypothetical protein HY778_12135 [Betaproteobacteria bacterium]|nr:hypothetical protein [Betaproteobacteria bacterium]